MERSDYMLYIVATPIGNLGDMSTNAIETLKKVDLILCEDTRTSSPLLKHFNINTKLMSYHKFNEQDRSPYLIGLLKEGKNIALISDAGTPCISDPGSILVHDAIKENIEIFSIPGPSAVITALTLSGLEIKSFSFYGFLSRKKNEQKKELSTINVDNSEIVILYESPKRLINTLENIKEVMNNPYTIVLNDLTKKFEKKYYGLADEVIIKLKENPNHELGEYVIVIKKNIYEQIDEEEQITIEALLINKMVKENCSMKEAIGLLSEEYKGVYSKNIIYNASLNIKRLFN